MFEGRKVTNPLISIILTTLNSERFLALSIESCLKQTYSNIELLIVDGGSTDRTIEIVLSYDDPRIRIIHQLDNAGKLPGALNLGMANAKGDFITWTQDDCWYVMDAMQVMVEYLLEYPEIGLVYSDYWLVDFAQRKTFYRPVNTPDHILDEDVIQQCFLFRRTVYETVGPQDERYYSVHEIPWRIKVVRHFRIAPLHVPLQYYMLHPGSLTGRFGGYTEQRKMAWAIYSEGYISKTEVVRRLAEIDIHQGYEMFVFNGEYMSFRRYFMSGIRKNLRFLRNVGLLKMFILSFTAKREIYRKNLYDEWLRRTELEQASLLRKYRPAPSTVREEIFDA